MKEEDNNNNERDYENAENLLTLKNMKTYIDHENKKTREQMEPSYKELKKAFPDDCVLRFKKEREQLRRQIMSDQKAIADKDLKRESDNLLEDGSTRIEVAKEKLNKLYDLFKKAETDIGEFNFERWSHNEGIEASCLVDEAWMEITLYLYAKDEAEANNDYSKMEKLK